MLSFNISITGNGGKDLTLLPLEETEKLDQADLLFWLKQNLVYVADQVLREEISKGFAKDFITVVDNSQSKKPEDVNPLGKIEFIAPIQSYEELIVPIYDAILKRSIVSTGLYRDSNIVLFNGVLIAKNMDELKAWFKRENPVKETDIFRFVNTTPYSGKLERQGRSAGRSPKTRNKKNKSKNPLAMRILRQPNGAYFLASRAILRDNKHRALISFQWMNGGQIADALKPKQDYMGNPLRTIQAKPSIKRRKVGAYAYPTIRVILR